MPDVRPLTAQEVGIHIDPEPQSDTIEVDAGTSSAVHELDLEGEAESVPETPIAPENMPLEERDA